MTHVGDISDLLLLAAYQLDAEGHLSIVELVCTLGSLFSEVFVVDFSFLMPLSQMASHIVAKLIAGFMTFNSTEQNRSR